MRAIVRHLLGLCLGAALLVAPDASARTSKKRAPRPRKPPIAYYLADEVKGATADQAIDTCLAEHTALHRKHPEVSSTKPERCQTRLMAVHGPYVRKNKKGKGGNDDPSVHVYKGRDGAWRDESGETAASH